MKLLFIYGAPAVGKFTVACEIAKLCNFKVFHNHLSIDCIKPIFDFGTPSFEKLIPLIRREVISEAVRTQTDLIFTFCYAKGIDDQQVFELTELVENGGGEICFILLTAQIEELRKRVADESRQMMQKIKTTEMLARYFENYELFSPVPHRPSLIIDNTETPPDAVAKQIVKRFEL